MTELLLTFGWLGSICLAICGAPAAYKVYKERHARGLSGPSIALWWLGEVLTLIYIVPQLNWPLIANYATNLVFVSVLVYYKIKEG